LVEMMADEDLEQQQFLSVSQYGPSSNIDGTGSSNTKGTKIGGTDDVSSVSSGPVPHAHPQAAFFTVLFKGLSIGAYIFGTWFSSNFILIFVFVVLCLACDFWTVKNVTGRLLVGMRWWNHIKEDGTAEWKYESKAANDINDVTSAADPLRKQQENKDSRLFWTSLYLTPCAWILLSVACIVKFNLKWLPLTLVGIALNGAQLWGYWKCRSDQKEQMVTADHDNSTSPFPKFIEEYTRQNIGRAIGNRIASQFQST